MLPLFHLAVVSLNTFTIWYDQKYINFPFRKEILIQDLPLKNRVLMLTMWCLTLQTVYFTVAFLNDILGSNERSPKRAPFIRKIKDALFSVAFPSALYVSAAFWGVYAIDKELIFPDMIEKEVPVWANHVMHTMITVFVLVELLLAARTYPSRKITISLTSIFVLSYLTFLHYNSLQSGTWLYPLLDLLPWHLRTLFFAISTLVYLVISIFGEKLDYVVNPKKEKAKQKKR